jgi:hypothetical protein
MYLNKHKYQTSTIINNVIDQGKYGRTLNNLCKEPQSHFILTMSYWSSGLTLCFLSQETWVQIPWGYLSETGILLLSLSHYIDDPDVIDHHCSLICGGLRPKLSRGPCPDNVIIPLDLTQLLCPSFTLTAGPPSSFTRVGCWGGGPC